MKYVEPPHLIFHFSQGDSPYFTTTECKSKPRQNDLTKNISNSNDPKDDDLLNRLRGGSTQQIEKRGLQDPFKERNFYL